MIDIVSIGNDMGFFDTVTVRAANILSVQIGALEYAPDLGIDLRYFLDEQFQFQNESFKAYLIQILSNYSINVTEVVDVLDRLSETYQFSVADVDQVGSFVAR